MLTAIAVVSIKVLTAETETEDCCTTERKGRAERVLSYFLVVVGLNSHECF